MMMKLVIASLLFNINYFYSVRKYQGWIYKLTKETTFVQYNKPKLKKIETLNKLYKYIIKLLKVNIPFYPNSIQNIPKTNTTYSGKAKVNTHKGFR